MKRERFDKAEIIVPVGLIPRPEQHELDVARILARHYDCVVEFLIPTDDYLRKTPDIVMNGREWEIKSPTGASKNTVEYQFVRARKQSKFLVFDARRTALDDENVERKIRFELRHRKTIREVIFIKKTEEVIEIIR